jgi:hypothetical protein
MFSAVSGARDLELISVVRALDAESRLGLQRPPLLAWLAEDYPEPFGPADLDKRLWLYRGSSSVRNGVPRGQGKKTCLPRRVRWAQAREVRSS